MISNCIEIVHLFLPKRIQWMFCTQIVHTWHWQEKMQSNMKNNWSKWLFYSVETIFLSKMVQHAVPDTPIMSWLNDPGWDHFSLVLGWIRSRNKVVANFFARRFSLQWNFKDSMFRRWLLEMKLMYDYLVIQFSPLPFFRFLKMRDVK